MEQNTGRSYIEQWFSTTARWDTPGLRGRVISHRLLNAPCHPALVGGCVGRIFASIHGNETRISLSLSSHALPYVSSFVLSNNKKAQLLLVSFSLVNASALTPPPKSRQPRAMHVDKRASRSQRNTCEHVCVMKRCGEQTAHAPLASEAMKERGVAVRSTTRSARVGREGEERATRHKGVVERGGCRGGSKTERHRIKGSSA